MCISMCELDDRSKCCRDTESLSLASVQMTFGEWKGENKRRTDVVIGIQSDKA